MKYKAIFIDVDGTILPYSYNAENQIPRKKTVEAIKKASEKIHVCLATGRPYFMLTTLLEKLDLTNGYAVINDGAQVIDIKNKKILYKKSIRNDDVAAISKILSSEGIAFFLNDGLNDFKLENIPTNREILNIFTITEVDENRADMLIDKLSSLSNIHVGKTHDGRTNKFELLISHQEATKLHGMIFVSKLLKVKREETIGVGDSGNDFQLLMASGLKVAMGNAIEGLKDVADYIAPSVDDEGLVDVINKFILE